MAAEMEGCGRISIRHRLKAGSKEQKHRVKGINTICPEAKM